MTSLQPHSPSLAARALAGIFRGYKLFISPYMPPACRYDPTCSVYAYQAVLAHGFFKGTWLAVRRIARCHPWGGEGHDPVPPR